MASKITFDLIGNDKSASKAIGGVQGKIGGVQSALKKVAGIAAAAFAVKAVAGFTRDLIVAAEEGVQVQNAMSNVASSMGLFGGETSKVTDRLNALADAQGRQIGVDDDVIRRTQTKLLTFKEVAATADDMGGYFDRATTAALDLAAAGFGTAEGNAVQLGKALNDPIKGISALAKSGVTFTESEKAKIEAMVESGNVAGAQETILKALETQVGGTAAASASASDKMKVAWAQVNGEIGELLLPAYNALADVVLDRVLPVVGSMVDFLRDKVGPGIGVFWQALTGGSEVGEFEGVLGIVNDVGARIFDFFSGIDLSMFSPLVDGFKAVVGALAPMLPALFEAATAFNPLHLIFQAIMPLLPQLAAMIGTFITTGVALIAPVIAQILPIISQLAALLVQALGQAFVQLMPMVSFLLATFMQLMPTILQLVPPILAVVTALMPLVGVVIELISTLLPPLIAIFQALLEPILALLPPLVESLAPVLALIATFIGDLLVPVISMLAKILGGLLVALAPVIGALVGGLVGALSAVIRWIANAAAGIARFVSSGISGFRNFMTTTRDIINKVVGFFRDMPSKIAGFFSSIGSRISAPFKSGFNAVARFWNNTAGKLSFTMPDWVPGIGGKGFSLPKIPYLASGGILTGPTLFMGGEGGETEVVQPLSKLSQFMSDFVPRDREPALSGDQILAISNLEVVVVDADGALVGRMRTEARQEITVERRAQRVTQRGRK